MKPFIHLFLLLAITACHGKGSAFQELEEQIDSDEPVEVAVEIQSVTPTQSPVVMTNGEVTFALSVNSGAGEVDYEFRLDETSVQKSKIPFYNLSGGGLSPGVHSLRVLATNKVSSDEHVFALRRNSPPLALTTSPTLNGNVVNCDEGTLDFAALSADVDGDSYSQSWFIDGAPVTINTPGVTVNNLPGNARLSYSPSCSVSGFHSISLRLSDPYETTEISWNVGVANPAVETIIGYYPTSNNITYLSTTVNSLFNVTGSGVGALTFAWTLDGVPVHTSTGGTTSNYTLPATAMSVGTHTLTVTLTDSSSTNDPAQPVARSWNIYRNQKPSIYAVVPSQTRNVNISTSTGLSATIEDNTDTFTTTITKGSLDCVPAAECGLSSVTLPTESGSFSALFTPQTAFLGSNNFKLTVTDSYGEESSVEFDVGVNYYSSACNNLAPGQVCTLVGLPGLGNGINVLTDANKIRITASRILRESTGSWFLADNVTNTVWYWNKSGATVNRLGINNIQNNQLVVVAGTGTAAAGGSGTIATRMGLNFGYWGGGLAWDSARGELFIADYSNSRVIRVDSTGRGFSVCGGSQQIQGGAANSALCRNPVDLAWDQANRYLYVATQTDHAIKLIDANNASHLNWTAYNILGVNGSLGSAGISDGTTNLPSFFSTIAGTARAWQPWGLYLDTDDQILYFTEYGSCRIRALGLPGATSRTVVGRTISAGNVTTLTATSLASTSKTACHSYAAKQSSNTNAAIGLNVPTNPGNPDGNFRGFNRPMDVYVEKQAGQIRGLYVTSQADHRVTFINSSGSALTVGNVSVPNGEMINVFGDGSTNSTNPASGVNTAIVNPIGIDVENGSIVVAALWDSKLKTLATAQANGAVNPNYFGDIGRAGYSGNAALDAALVTFSSPQSLVYKESGGSVTDPILGDSLYISDIGTNYIRRLDLPTGRIEDFIGTGSHSGTSTQNTIPTSTLLADVRGMAFLNEFFIYSDINSNCMVRALNPNTVTETLFGTSINQGRISTIIGNFNNCGNFLGTAPLFLDEIGSARLNNPWGLGVDAARNIVYIASRDSHCILKATDSGLASTLEPFIGTCGTSPVSPAYGGPLASLQLRFPQEIKMDTRPGLAGNFFFTDWSDWTAAHVKYVNIVSPTDVEFFGGSIRVAQGTAETIFGESASPGRIESIALYDSWMCFASTLSNTISCRDRDTGASQTFGVSGSGGLPLGTEQEGISATSPSSILTFAYPQGVEFDKDGNLYVVERVGHQIRKIVRWFP